MLIGDYWLLWYLASNSYSVVDNSFKATLDHYFASSSIHSFKHAIGSHHSIDDIDSLNDSVETYLNNCNISLKKLDLSATDIDVTQRLIVRHYRINKQVIQIHFSSVSILNLIHPAIAHLSVKTSNTAATHFDIYIKDDMLYLFKDKRLVTAVPKKDYHFIQGKFIMQLLCAIYQNEEKDWIGTFHGSTITDGHTSIMFVGASGKGKSTLCALLCANGFDLLADDVSPMLSKNSHIYHNPSAISIKAGAHDLLRPLTPDFDKLPSITINKTKGPITYLPCKRPKEDHYPCQAIVLVNYQKNTKTQLERASIKTLLQTLIPDSWISPDPLHARQFLDWLNTVNIYKLTYSDTQSVTKEISQLFNKGRENS
jgi:hypothetical protein